MKILLQILLVAVAFINVTAQVVDHKVWCISTCNAVGDEMQNTKQLYGRRGSISNDQGIGGRFTTKRFPIRIGIVNNSRGTSLKRSDFDQTITLLNEGFEGTGMTFYIDQVDQINENLTIEELTENGYEVYNRFSDQYDKDDMISVYFFDYDPALCDISATSISCARTGGFSYILSYRTNNIVLSKFDRNDAKVIVHEMGHFFGLYHTFEEQQFGKDNFVEDCNVAGDCLCDTPPDPGPAYEVYVHTTNCKMEGLRHENGNMYNPIINNYMTYYKPCYLQPYLFTQAQKQILTMAANSEFRQKFKR